MNGSKLENDHAGFFIFAFNISHSVAMFAAHNVYKTSLPSRSPNKTKR